MKLSRFGEKFTTGSGILALMDDLGKALSGSEKKYMLGGGNPAHIPEINAIWHGRLQQVLETPGAMDRMLANYDPPQGNVAFIEALARLLNRELGWEAGPENIAVTNGSQTSFYLLFNMLAGTANDGRRRRILFPLMPEYIGYADQGIEQGSFVAHRPVIDEIDRHTFKYRVDFSAIEVGTRRRGGAMTRALIKAIWLLDAGFLLAHGAWPLAAALLPLYLLVGAAAGALFAPPRRPPPERAHGT